MPMLMEIAPVIDWTGVDFSTVIQGVTEAIPQVVPVVVTFLGIRKGISFVMGMIHGA